MPFLIFVTILLEWLHVSNLVDVVEFVFQLWEARHMVVGPILGVTPALCNNGEQPTKQACVLLVLLFIK
jgi:hypothetical protein